MADGDRTGELSHVGGFPGGAREGVASVVQRFAGVLSAERLITLEEVMQDGTKIQARASGKTFRREKTLREHVERARLQVEALRDPLAEPAVNRRQQAARERASREKRERLEQALVELEK